MTRTIGQNFYREHKYFCWLLIYGLFYLVAFGLLEQRSVRVHLIHCRLDDLIPFCKYFIIPYLLWFPFMAAVFFYFGLVQKDQTQMARLFWNLTIGTTLFLFVSWVYPNGQRLRPALYGDDLFSQAVRHLYQVDTPTNILPSLHVYGTVVGCLAVLESPQLRETKAVRIATVILSLSIIASTVLLKQHSVIDGITAILLNTVCYVLCYRTDWMVQTGRLATTSLSRKKKRLRYHTSK